MSSLTLEKNSGSIGSIGASFEQVWREEKDNFDKTWGTTP